MKKFILSFFGILFICSSAYSQGKNIILSSSNYDQYFLVGKLPYHSNSNAEKLKVIVFGGSYHNTTLGEETFYISTRDGIKINREIHGGSTERFELRIYDNGSSYDFVIHFTNMYPSVQVRSWHLYNGTSTDFEIVAYDPLGKTDLTSQHLINNIFSTSNNGNVGIGTTTPDEKLTVKGNIHAEEVRVDLSVPAPDYVFEPDYDLITLDKISEYIQINKHLPEVPSAGDFEISGIELSKMNMLLLKKVEELTLYTIDQEGQLKTQAQLIEEQNKLLNELLLRIEKIENNEQ